MRVKIGDVLTGPAGRAEEILAELEPSDPPSQRATVASWFLTCPGQSIAWSHYGMAVFHLRPIPDAEPAQVRVPGATHELMLLAYNPEANPRADDPASWRHLVPGNVAEQVQLPDDAAAVRLARLAAQAVVDGVLWAEPPLSGQVEPWRTALIKTAAHARGEEHAP